MIKYDPNEVGLSNGHIFSLPHGYQEAEIILVPASWDVTTSYKDGTSNGPEVILNASSQLDLFHPSLSKIWDYGAYMMPIDEDMKSENSKLRKEAVQHIQLLETNAFDASNSLHQQQLNLINEGCFQVKNKLSESVLSILNDTKKVGLVGGDHSCALGCIEALSHHHESFGILQIDAHADLRETYENFTYSHASIFYNVLKFREIHSLSQVGIRDISPGEADRIIQDKRINCFYDWDLKSALYNGVTWDGLCRQIINELPEKVYISFDIDGLQPFLCPNTGTPVPGGLTFEQATYLIDVLVKSGRQIIGFDLCEVNSSNSNSDWDANVGARILFQLCTALHLSNG